MTQRFEDKPDELRVFKVEFSMIEHCDLCGKTGKEDGFVTGILRTQDIPGGIIQNSKGQELGEWCTSCINDFELKKEAAKE